MRLRLGLSAAIAFALNFGPAEHSAAAKAPLTIDDYRLFRALTIDLRGRMPTAREIAELESDGFDLDTWIDKHLGDAEYADRLTRVYMDLLRLEPGPAVELLPDATTLYRHQILGPNKKPVWIYYRARQRRAREETDGELCLTTEETGLVVQARSNITKGEAKPVSKKVLDAHTVLVKPWWLYEDYANPAPGKRYQAGWHPDSSFRPVEGLLTEPDGMPTIEVRVCKEEAQAQATGHVHVTSRKPPPKGAEPPRGRTRFPPLDTVYAKQHAGDVVACNTRLASDSSLDCGCGVGLERCIPADGDGGAPSSFYFPNHMPLGIDQPLDSQRQNTRRYFPLWWSAEARHFFDHLWREDRDFREVLTGRWTVINGPLAQFYGSIQPANCCAGEASFGMPGESAPLFVPEAVPTDLHPQDAGAWRLVADRGPRAAGILTMPIYLEKYASDRARGAAIYTAFMCKSFVAENAQLVPSAENDLTKRPGCSTCHATLEPLAAYFARIEQANFVYLPPDKFPVENPTCKKNDKGAIAGPCNAFYDPAFADGRTGVLRSAYASHAHADGGPVLAARDVAESGDFAACAVARVAASFLGRPLGADDAALQRELVSLFVKDGYRMKSLVRAVVRADAYRRANNVSSDEWRKGTPPPTLPADGVHGDRGDRAADGVGR